ncbi:hypothetical protein H0H93_002451 [Arthromyces matolae]|nr:hypothetical protein H0H93_002451 [Arthromyces matolae]
MESNAADSVVPEKRPRGRPKGTKNVVKAPVEGKRPVGRPKGSKNKQKEGQSHKTSKSKAKSLPHPSNAVAGPSHTALELPGPVSQHNQLPDPTVSQPETTPNDDLLDNGLTEIASPGIDHDSSTLPTASSSLPISLAPSTESLATLKDGATNLTTCDPSQTTAICDVADLPLPLPDITVCGVDEPLLPAAIDDSVLESAVGVGNQCGPPLFESFDESFEDVFDELGIEEYIDEFLPLPDDEEAPEMQATSTRAPLADSEACEGDSSPHKLRLTLPTWLKECYSDICLQLRKEMSSNPSHQPSCYERGEFYMHDKAPFFQTRQITQLTPSMFYQPRFFIWMPHVFDKIACPDCAQAGRKTDNGSTVFLRLHGWPRTPRRVIDVNDNLYIVGYRYLCGQCKKTFQSWSPKILNIISRPLASQFTFHLTYRCGLTDGLATLLRASFQRGQGPRPFADMIRRFHIRKYELLEMQYLELVKLRSHFIISSFFPLHEPFSAWNDLSGYAGYIPSPQYFGTFYNHLIEGHASEIDQHMSMLSARIICIDHSFKVPKHVGKVGGEPAFGALHTAVNEYGEIREMTLTPTKSHDQFMPALAHIPHSLRKYGHGDIEGVFTDSAADKQALEQIIPSLLKDVVPPAATTLDSLKLPQDWSCSILKSTFQINTRLNVIMDSLSRLSEHQSIAIALDMEWSVDQMTGIQGRISVVSIAFEKCVYIIQLSSFVENGFLHPPHVLLSLLRSSRVKKVGVHIKADFTRFFKDCGFGPNDAPFLGAVELGAISKERQLTQRANISLADLTAIVLRKHLLKDADIRVSSAWDNAELTDQQTTYAALDVYAAWAIYNAFTHIAVGKLATSSTTGGTPVKLLSRDTTSVVAYGFISPYRSKDINTVQVTNKHVIVNVTSILQPAYLVRGELLKSRVDTPLHQITIHTPFLLLCLAQDVQITTSGSPLDASEKRSAPLPSLPYIPNSPAYSDPTLPDDGSSTDDLETPETDENWIESMPFDAEKEDLTANATSDVQNVSRAQAMLSNSTVIYGDTEIRSRVWIDIWHLMHQFKIPTHHGLRRPFSRALRDAIFLPDPEDKMAVEALLSKHNVSWDQMVLWRPEWVWRRVKRFVPNPDVLYQRVSSVFATFGPLKDSKTTQALFNEASWKSAENILKNIRLGLYSDPPGIDFYMFQGYDNYGLSLYRSIRGTNHVEGGVHQNIIRRFGSFNASPRFVVNLIRDYCITHNLKVGAVNRTGKEYQGSFDIWTLNRLSSLRDQTTQIMVPDSRPRNWVNGNDYEKSSETFGILPVSAATRTQLGMLEFHNDYTVKEKTRHTQLAKLQSTRIAILPLHTPNERALFSLTVGRRHGPFSGPSTPDWIALASMWSDHCDGKTIFYKVTFMIFIGLYITLILFYLTQLPEHLKNYYKAWLELRNEKNSVEENHSAYKQLQTYLMPVVAAIPTIPVQAPVPLNLAVNVGKRGTEELSSELEMNEMMDDWEINTLLGRQTTKQFAIHLSYSEGSTPAPLPKGTKRGYGHANITSDEVQTKKIKTRAARTCTACHRTDCEGKWARQKCKNKPPEAAATATSFASFFVANAGPSSKPTL